MLSTRPANSSSAWSAFGSVIASSLNDGRLSAAGFFPFDDFRDLVRSRIARPLFARDGLRVVAAARRHGRHPAQQHLLLVQRPHAAPERVLRLLALRVDERLGRERMARVAAVAKRLAVAQL